MEENAYKSVYYLFCEWMIYTVVVPRKKKKDKKWRKHKKQMSRRCRMAPRMMGWRHFHTQPLQKRLCKLVFVFVTYSAPEEQQQEEYRESPKRWSTCHSTLARNKLILCARAVYYNRKVRVDWRPDWWDDKQQQPHPNITNIYCCAGIEWVARVFTLLSMESITPILEETLEPPTTAANGLLGSATAPFARKKKKRKHQQTDEDGWHTDKQYQ